MRTDRCGICRMRAQTPLTHRKKNAALLVLVLYHMYTHCSMTDKINEERIKSELPLP